MRISTSQMYSNQKNSINDRMAEYVRLQQMVSTGKRILSPSDDPAGTSLLLKSRSIKNALSQYSANLRTATDYVSNSENTLKDVQDLMRQSYSMALQGANGSTPQESRTGMAQQIAQMQDQLVRLANTRGNSGQYIFAGQINDQPPYSASGGVLTYAGDHNPITVETAPDTTMPVNTDASDNFTNAYARLESLRQNLIGGNTGAISGVDISNLQATIDDLTQLRGAAGSVLQHVQKLDEFNTRRTDELTKQISGIEDVDLTTAITDMSQAQVAYQAALTVSSNSFRLSLMDYLK